MATSSFLGLEGMHILVTGASGGIGISLVSQLVSQGAYVSCHHRSPVEADSRLAMLHQSFPEKTLLVQADASVESDVVRCVEEADRWRPLDSLVLNHGVFPPKDTALFEMSLSQWNDTIRVNLTGCFLFAREFMRLLRARVSGLSMEELKEQRGSIVMIGSTSGIFGEYGHADYSCSKAAMMYGLCPTLKNEFARIIPRGRVNVVAPGWVRTPMAEDAMEDKPTVAKVFQTLAMRKIAEPSDVSNATCFLLSDRAAGHISGSTLPVHGGMEGRRLYTEEEVMPFV